MSGLAGRIRKFGKNPKLLLPSLNARGYFKRLPDKTLIQLLWWALYDRKIDLRNPEGFNEKIQWLKLYDRRPEYTALADKYLVRRYVADKIGEDYLFPLYAVWDNADDIDFDILPNQFVLKCNHNSGGAMCVCRDKSRLNRESIVREFGNELKKNYYWYGREWVYKDIVPKIIAEKYMVDHDPANTSGTLIDYKFFCFNGEPRFLYVGTDDVSAGKKGELKCSFLDLDWKQPPFSRPDHKTMDFDVPKPPCMEEMLDVSRKLSANIPFVRVDLYWIDGKVYFSELTFYPGRGFAVFSPQEWEEKIGSWLVLPEKQTGEQ